MRAGSNAGLLIHMDNEQKPRLRTLKNGAVYDLDKHRIVANDGGGTAAITTANASEFHARRQARKRERIEAGANAALAELAPEKWASPADLDFAEAIAEAAMHKALNPDDPKQIDAGRFLLQEAGLAETRGAAAEHQPVNDVFALLDKLAEIADAAARAAEARTIVDAEAVEK